MFVLSGKLSDREYCREPLKFLSLSFTSKFFSQLKSPRLHFEFTATKKKDESVYQINTVNSRLADTPIIRTAAKSPAKIY